MDSAYVDKLDGKIPEDFWERKMAEWRTEEQKVKFAIDGLDSTGSSDRALEAQRVSELANKACLFIFCGILRKSQTDPKDVFELYR